MTTKSWLLPTLAMLPVLLGVFLLVGVPWTLVVFPVQDRRDRILTGTVGLALGAMITTTILFRQGRCASACCWRRLGGGWPGGWPGRTRPPRWRNALPWLAGSG